MKNKNKFRIDDLVETNSEQDTGVVMKIINTKKLDDDSDVFYTKTVKVGNEDVNEETEYGPFTDSDLRTYKEKK